MLNQGHTMSSLSDLPLYFLCWICICIFFVGFVFVFSLPDFICIFSVGFVFVFSLSHLRFNSGSFLQISRPNGCVKYFIIRPNSCVNGSVRYLISQTNGCVKYLIFRPNSCVKHLISQPNGCVIYFIIQPNGCVIGHGSPSLVSRLRSKYKDGKKGEKKDCQIC